MKKKITISLGLVMLILSILMIGYIILYNKKPELIVNKRPNIPLYKIDGFPYVTSNIENTTLMFFYKSDCPYCKAGAENILKSIDKLKKVEILFISSEPAETIERFSLNYSSERIKFLSDENKQLSIFLGVKKFPSIFIFSKRDELIRNFIGVVTFEQILAEIPNE